MYSILVFFLFLFVIELISPLFYAYPIVGMLFWIGLLAWMFYSNKRRRDAYRRAQQQQQDYMHQQYSQNSSESTSGSRPNVDSQDIIDAEYTEHEIK